VSLPSYGLFSPPGWQALSVWIAAAFMSDAEVSYCDVRRQAGTRRRHRTASGESSAAFSVFVARAGFGYKAVSGF